MKIAIFTDIHGNYYALDAILKDIKNEKVDEIICLGDVISLGPDSDKCVELVMNNNVTMSLGNHELYLVLGPQIDDEMSSDEIEHQKWIKSLITDKQYEYIKNCKLYIEKEYGNKKFLFEHFLIDYDTKEEYPFHDLECIKNGQINKIVDELDYDLIFVGHEHKAFCIDNKLYDVGSSGCTKDEITHYTILDTDTLEVITKNLVYDRKKFVESIENTEYIGKEIISKIFFGL